MIQKWKWLFSTKSILSCSISRKKINRSTTFSEDYLYGDLFYRYIFVNVNFWREFSIWIVVTLILLNQLTWYEKNLVSIDISFIIQKAISSQRAVLLVWISSFKTFHAFFLINPCHVVVNDANNKFMIMLRAQLHHWVDYQ